MELQVICPIRHASCASGLLFYHMREERIDFSGASCAAMALTEVHEERHSSPQCGTRRALLWFFHQGKCGNPCSIYAARVARYCSSYSRLGGSTFTVGPSQCPVTHGVTIFRYCLFESMYTTSVWVLCVLYEAEE